MKRVLLSFSVITALAGVFAFRSAETSTHLKPTDITVYENVLTCHSLICGDYTGTTCKDLFQLPNCTSSYTGNLKRKP
jgi:hypothetical protein